MLQQPSPVCSPWLSCGTMTWPFSLCSMQEEKKKQRKERKYIQIYISNHKHNPPHTHMGMHAVAKTQQTSPGRGVWPASQKLLTHSKKVRGTLHQRFVGRFFFFFYLLIGSQKWMLWENICGRGCSELSCTAWTDGLGLRVEGGLCGVEGGCGAAAEAGHRQKRRRGFKKSRAWGLVGGVVLFFFFFPSLLLSAGLFSRRGCCDLLTLMRWVQTGYREHGLSFLVLA